MPRDWICLMLIVTNNYERVLIRNDLVQLLTKDNDGSRSCFYGKDTFFVSPIFEHG